MSDLDIDPIQPRGNSTSTWRATLRGTPQRLARLPCENGVASQLDVLDAERNLLAAELNRSDALRAQRAAVADLLKALGGGWNPGSGS